MEEFLPWLYLKGVSTGDFQVKEPCATRLAEVIQGVQFMDVIEVDSNDEQQGEAA